ncbi:MAG: glycosyltransferase, partial [Deltaproteobacteria bacterium]
GFQNQSHLPNYYYAADVLVVPSVKEPWGLVVNEAMASGTPVIASDCVGASYDLIEVGKTGYVFKSNDQESLAKTLVRFYETFSQSGFSSDYIRSKVSAFNIENSASGFVEALRSIKNRNLF